MAQFRHPTATNLTGPVHNAGGPQSSGERRFSYYWGRRRVKIATLMPQDQREMERLDFQHHLLRQVCGRNYLAPIGWPESILDIGCGTGRWAIEMADEFPAAVVVGADLLPPAPYGWTPSNCFFQYGNILDTLPFSDGSFDFVHQRCFLDAVPYQAWSHIVHELLRMTSSRGTVELVEFGLPPSLGPALSALYQLMLALADRQGFDLRLADRLGWFLHAAGAANITTQALEIPLGQHGGRLGMLAQINLISVLRTLRAAFIQARMTDEGTFDALLDEASHELETGRYMLPVHVLSAQRPG
jgi:SAM-dependent methyltransferase